MKILLTNDDGIGSPGLRLLANWAKDLGEVMVCAPKKQQSAKSMAINIHSPFEVKKVDFPFDIPAYSVDSTPADCVRIATAHLGFDCDLVISGVNEGLNVGTDIVYSATVAAIFEGATEHRKGLALSTDPSSFDGAANTLDEVWSYIRNNNLFAENDLYNVNIPLESKGILLTRQAGPYYRDVFDVLPGDLCLANGYSVYKGTANLDLDLDAVMNGYTSVTPLTLSRTALSAYDRLKQKGL